MKKFFMFLMVLGATSIFAQTADEIVNNHIKAIGGIDNWRKVTTAYSELSTDMGGMKVPVKIWQIDAKGMRVEFVVQGMTGIQVITDKSGWSLMPFMGQTNPEPTPEEQLKAAQSQLDLKGQLIDYAQKGSNLEFIGEDVEDGVEVYKLKLIEKSGAETTFFIDKESYYILKTSTKVKIQGQEVDSVTSYGNYKKVGDIMFPHSINGGMGNATIEKMELNSKIEATMFDMPAKK